MTLAPASQYVTVDDVRLHYQEIPGPAGAETVVFTHGGGPGSTGWSNWRASAEAFSAHYRCIYLDFPLFGQSDCVPVQGLVFSWHAHKLLGFLDALGLPQAHLVNQSFGGCVAIRFAADHPERVGRMTLIGSQPISGGVMAPLPLFSKHAATLMSDYFFADGGPSIEKMRALIRKYELLDDNRLDEENARLRFKASNNPNLLQLLSVQGPAAFGEWEDLVPMFSQVKAPTLILWGLHDWFGGIDVPLLMLNRFADARLHVMGKAAHHLQSEYPAEFDRVALPFLRGTS